jgi:hypothetical protein
MQLSQNPIERISYKSSEINHYYLSIGQIIMTPSFLVSLLLACCLHKIKMRLMTLYLNTFPTSQGNSFVSSSKTSDLFYIFSRSDSLRYPSKSISSSLSFSCLSSKFLNGGYVPIFIIFY